ncbi:MAG: CoA transferase [Dehalococcoidia bacterium]|nr:CoA transferase [Dehalococcoidia bacterium]
MTYMNKDIPDAPRAWFTSDCDLSVQSARALSLFGWEIATSGATERYRRCGVTVTQSQSNKTISEAEMAAAVTVGCTCAPDGGVSAIHSCSVVLSGCEIAVDDADVGSSCSELLAYMRSGLGLMTRVRTDEGLRGTPFLPAGHLAAFFAGLHVALILEALRYANVEAPARIKVSAQECLLATLHNAAGFAQLQDRDVSRGEDPRHAGGRFSCVDGDVLVSLPDAHHWDVLLTILGNPEWAEGGWWRDQNLRFSNRELLNDAIGNWCRNRKRTDVFALLQQSGIPAAYLASPADVEANPHLLARNAGNSTPHQTRYSALSGNCPRRSHEAPAPAKPLAGVRVADFSWAWSGPYLTMSLAMLGAEVVKIENHLRLDIHREQPPFVPGPEPVYDRAVGHLLTNRGKLSLAADLKDPHDLEIVKALVSSSDILVANFTPGVLEKLGFSFDAVAELVGPRPFVYLTLTGFGREGPWANYRSYGTHLADLSGLSSLTGSSSSGPVSIAIPFADPLAGMYGAVAATHFLRQSDELGSPVAVDISQFEVVTTAIRDALQQGEPAGNRRQGDMLPTGIYQAAGDDSWVAVHVRCQEDLSRLQNLLGEPMADALDKAVARWTADRSAADAERELLHAGIACTQVLSVAELLRDPVLAANHFWEPHQGNGWTVLGPASPWHINGERSPQLHLAPMLGSHSRAISTMLQQGKTQR